MEVDQDGQSPDNENSKDDPYDLPMLNQDSDALNPLMPSAHGFSMPYPGRARSGFTGTRAPILVGSQNRTVGGRSGGVEQCPQLTGDAVVSPVKPHDLAPLVRLEVGPLNETTPKVSQEEPSPDTPAADKDERRHATRSIPYDPFGGPSRQGAPYGTTWTGRPVAAAPPPRRRSTGLAPALSGDIAGSGLRSTRGWAALAHHTRYTEPRRVVGASIDAGERVDLLPLRSADLLHRREQNETECTLVPEV